MNASRTYLFLFFLLVGSTSFSQSFRNPNAWRLQRHEFTLSVGASNFMSDLGGRDMIGSDFLWDLEFSKTRPAAGLSYMYYLSEKLGWRTGFQWGWLEGDDKLTAEPFRMNRNLNARTQIYEMYTWLEWHIVKESKGNRYGLKSHRTGRRIGAKRRGIGMYLFAGFGGTYFNPKGNQGNGWVALKPLHTEGQGLPGGPSQYSGFTATLPMGFGLRRSMGQFWSIGLRFSYRFTFSDYLDDVSGVYYDPTELGNAYGAQSVAMADPSLGMAIGAPDIPPTSPGQQRGDITDKDGYMFAQLTVTYRPKWRPKGRGRYRHTYYRSSF